jgi:hypothetical protein
MRSLKILFCVILLMATGKPFADALVDDFEGGINQNKFGYDWYFFNDSKDGGNSSIPGVTQDASGNYIVAPAAGAGYNSTAGLVLPYVLGPTAAGAPPSYIGMGTMLCNNGQVIDLTGATSITFWLKSQYAISLDFQLVDTVDITDFGYYYKTCTIPAGVWTQFVIPLTSGGSGGLAQYSWTTKKVPFTLKNISKLQWQISLTGVGTNTTGQVTIDNVSIQGYTYFPPSPVLILPANNANNVAVNTTLRWLSSPSAASYRVQVSTDSTFSTVFKDSSGIIDTSVSLSGLSNATKYFWRVNSTNVNGTSLWPTANKFVTIPLPPATPITISPVTGTVNVPIPTSLSWHSSPTATAYRLQISTTANFNNIVKDTTGISDTSISLSGLANSTQYYWCVSALNAGGTSGWSVTASFTTIIGTSTIVSPASGSENLPIAVTVVWHSVPTASTYRLQLSTASNFTPTIKDTVGAIDTSINLLGLVNNTQYFWRVNVTNAGGTGSWTATANFTTIVAIPGMPSPISPRAGAQSIPIPTIFIWHSVSTAASYRIQVSTTSDFNGIIKDTSGLIDTSFTFAGLSNNKKYYWCVNAANVGGISNWMPTDSFTTIALPSVVALLSPSDTAKLQADSVLLVWNKDLAPVTAYFLQVATDSGMTHVFYQDSTLSDTTKPLKSLSANIMYWWHVKAQGLAGWGHYSPKLRFTYVVSPTAILPKKFKIMSLSCTGSQSILKYALPHACYVSLKCFDVGGRLVASFVNQTQNEGYYSFLLPISHLAKGTYIQEFRAGDFLKEDRFVVMR